MEQSKSQHLVRKTAGLVSAGALLLIAAIVAFASMYREEVNAAPLLQAGTPTVAFVSSTFSVNENISTGVATIFVQMDITSPTPVTVEYLSVAGTATPGVDYTSVSGTLTFTVSAVAPQTQSFTVPILDDVIDEPNETVNLVLRNPSGAVLGATDTAILTINDNDPPATATATATSGAPPIFLDAYEPNNTISQAFPTSANAADLCNITLWPVGDEDYFSFWARSGLFYEVSTKNLEPGIDTLLTVFNPQGVALASNDDRQPGNRASLVGFTAGTTGFYYARIINQDPSDPADKTYCLGVLEQVPPTPTVTSTFSPLAGDSCEFNSTIQTACLIGAGETKQLDFEPSLGSPQDTDIFRMWVKPGIRYTCETDNLSSVNDTNIILLDSNGNAFNPPIGNDDKAPGDLGSLVQYFSTYTGWLYIMVGPVNPPVLSESSLYTYELTCLAEAATPTSTPRPTSPPAPGGTFRTPTPSPTPIVFPTFPPTPTPIDLSQFATSLPPDPPVVRFNPLPTPTRAGADQQVSSVSVTVYYDLNENFTPEMEEGIVDVAVALYEQATGQLLQFGHTNDAGMLTFGSIGVDGAVRVEVPFLKYNQVVLGTNTNILVRVAPQPLPDSIP